MRRREVLAFGCATCASALAGCSAQDVGFNDGERRHPFAGKTVRVRVDDRSDTHHDVRENARQSLDYWAKHAETFAGFDVGFEVVDGDPDMAITYVDSPEPCHDVEGYSERVLGCAPVITPRHRLPEEVTAYVVAAGRPFGQIRTTTKHELGHVLGLYHDDEPRHIMSNRPEDRIPMYTARIDVWETVLEAGEQSADATRLFNHGIETWNDEQYEASGAAFKAANEAFVAGSDLVDTARERAADLESLDEGEDTIALETVYDHLHHLSDRMAAAQGFTRSMTSAAEAAADGDGRRANDHLAAANEDIRAFNDLGGLELRRIAVALGLVRGFDHEDDGVDIDDEAVE